MRRALLVSYWLAPRNAIGSIRPGHLFKHLPDYGWSVTALTARFENGANPLPDAILTGYADVKSAVKRMFGISGRGTHEALNLEAPAYGRRRSLLQHAIFAAASVVTYPDEQIGWLPFAVPAIRKALSDGRFDAVLSSAPPMTTNLAVPLARPRVPWIADMRDLWAENDTSERSWLQTLFDDRLERCALRGARVLTATSELSAERFRRRYPDKPVYAISTGFEQTEWTHVPFAKERACTLVYAGNLYRGKRDPAVLFGALARLFALGVPRERLSVDFYSPREPWLLERIAEFKLADVVHVHGLIDRAALLEIERRADRLLVFLWDGPTAEGIVPGKIFEYFGARRPVLAFGGTQRSAVSDLLEQTKSGALCRNEAHAERELLAALLEHPYEPRIIDAANVAAYTSAECARRFASLLDAAAGTRAPVPQIHIPQTR